MKKGQKIEKEYIDAPSGSVIFYNYKEPLMQFEGGHGYEGALIFDSKTDKIQCHFCGEWYGALGHHLKREHNMTAESYKKKVGLNKTTALINEETRKKLIAAGMKERIRNLRPNKKVSDETKEKIRATLLEHRSEVKNGTGTCPAQLIDRLVALYNKLKRTPLRREIIFHEALVKTYGSMEEACRIAGIPYRKEGQTLTAVRTSMLGKEKVVTFVREFFDKNGKLPKGKQIPKNFSYQIIKHGRKEIFRMALSQDGVYKKVDTIIRYDKDQLIDFLRVFEKVNKRKPSYSDCRRGLLPHLSRYSYHFGSWKKTLAIAFPDYANN